MSSASCSPAMMVTRLERNVRVQVLPDLGYEASQTMPESGLGSGGGWLFVLSYCELLRRTTFKHRDFFHDPNDLHGRCAPEVRASHLDGATLGRGEPPFR